MQKAGQEECINYTPRLFDGVLVSSMKPGHHTSSGE